ncbi:MAG: YraN family protein [Gemmatimonadota bacterium]|nr:YraN family protein [Gemmatimonadota bacterium]
MTIDRQEMGRRGERVAELFLRERGWRVLSRRFRSGHRDIDLIVERSGLVVFVEVKARSGAEFGDPVEAVNWKKRRELVRSSSVWIERYGGEASAYRFDVIGVLFRADAVRVRHVEDAFAVTVRS